nr:MAG TPA: Kruppel-like factor 3 finger, kruppel-like, DNA BINDING [Caudoviricetes sp.]
MLTGYKKYYCNICHPSNSEPDYWQECEFSGFDKELKIIDYWIDGND